jgi:serine phosphatase RsbU (regulator of sigma subunit)
VPANRFATLFLARLDTAAGDLRWVNAGHAGPLVARADGGHEVLEPTGTILGAFPDLSWDEGRTRLGAGDVLVLLSDGVREASRAAGSDLGPERLAAAVRAIAARRRPRLSRQRPRDSARAMRRRPHLRRPAPAANQPGGRPREYPPTHR